MKAWALTLTLLSPTIWAQMPLSGLCFSPGTNLAQVRAFLAPILLGADQVHERSSLGCLEIALSPARLELFEKFLARRYPVVRSYQESGNTPGLQLSRDLQDTRHCRLELTTTTLVNRESMGVNTAGQVEAQALEASSEGVNRMQLMLSSGRPGSLHVFGQELSLLCVLVGDQRAQLTIGLSARKNGFTSSVQVQKGVPLDLGQVVQELEQRERSVSLQDGVKIESASEKSQQRYVLTLQ